jgi:DMSO/TMAO reductase YedYZ molybdopterin-dependent catalytic subunit
MVQQPRGVKRPKIAPELADRVPPGQFPTPRWPVLHHGPIPPFDPATWDFRVFGLVERPLRLTWDEFRALPRTTATADLHCVSRWSKLDNAWEGVPARELVARARPAPEARFVLLHADGGYTANLPLAALDDLLLALAHDGQELTPEHGYPVRAVVPGRYAWKSAKWLRAIELLADDRPGFWEQYGYSTNADPWREERFAE